MKILRVCQEYEPLVSGPIKQASAIAAGLAQRGHTNIIVASNEGTDMSPESLDASGDRSTTVQRFPVLFKFMRYYYLRGVEHYLRNVQADIFHVHGWRNHAADIAIQIARQRGIPSVLHAHGMAKGASLVKSGVLKLPYLAYDVLFKQRILQADAVVVSTAQERSECIEYGFSADTIHIIPSGINPEDYVNVTKTRSPSPATPRALFVGRLSRDRNVELAIKAVGLVRDAGIEVELRVVGGEEKRTQASQSGYLDELKHLVARLELSGHVTFAGQRTGPALLQEYVDADIFVYTSLYENFGNTVLEAAAAGLPLLVTATGVANDLVKRGEVGYLVSTSDPTDLARHLRELVLDANLRAAFGNGAARIARRDYDWKEIVGAYECLYQSLARRDARYVEAGESR